MMKRALYTGAIVAALVVFAAGCRPPCTGSAIPSHPKPGGCCYYNNWDSKAASIDVTPVEDVNPVGTQHVFVATVRDEDGNPLVGRRVEWMIADGVGTIVEVDESGVRARGYKMDNHFAVSHTNTFDHVITRGNDDPSDDIHLTKGQTWCVITSPVEGTTHVVAYAPAIHNWDNHKAFVKKHWFNIGWEFPPEAVNPIGTPHEFTTRVTTYLDKKPLPGYEVTYRIVSGPDAVLEPGGGETATVKTNAQGLATVTLKQVKPVEGVNELAVSIVKPDENVQVASGTTSKTWIGPKIALAKSATPKALIGQQIQYDIVVSNPSEVGAGNAVLVDNMPEGIEYVSSKPAAKVDGRTLTWNLGAIAPGGRSVVTVLAKTTKVGTFHNTARVTADHGLVADAAGDTVVASASIKMTQKAPAEVLICEPITYVITVTNSGDVPATNVKLEDKLPDGLLYQNKHDTVTANIGTLNPGESKNVQFDVRATKTGTFTNSSKSVGDNGLTADAESTTVVRQPVLEVAVDVPDEHLIVHNITYTANIANKGDGQARNLTVQAALPAGSTFVSASDGGRAEGGSVVWSLNPLAPDAARKVSFTVKPARAGNVETLVTATAKCAKGSARAATAVKGIPAILFECVDQEDPIVVGSNETYTIIVTNQGSAPDTNIVIKCTLPEEQELVSANGPTRAAAQGRNITFAPLKSLDPGAKATYKVVVKAIKAGNIRFTTSLESDQLKVPVTETESTNQYAAE